MLPFEYDVCDASISMMGRVLCNECHRRRIEPNSLQGEDLARIIMHAFLAGITGVDKLAATARDLVD